MAANHSRVKLGIKMLFLKGKYFGVWCDSCGVAAEDAMPKGGGRYLCGSEFCVDDLVEYVAKGIWGYQCGRWLCLDCFMADRIGEEMPDMTSIVLGLDPLPERFRLEHWRELTVWDKLRFETKEIKLRWPIGSGGADAVLIKRRAIMVEGVRVLELFPADEAAVTTLAAYEEALNGAMAAHA